ncbi:MAG: hypothetical protein NTV55_10255 [Planctomycetota bacterium]|nr:hypothetical protein [Planctomycetota bacterium]
MRRCLTLYGLTAILGVSGVYGQEQGKNDGQKAPGQKVPVEGVKTPTSPGKTNATVGSKVIGGVQIKPIEVKEGQPIAKTKIIVLDEDFIGELPENIHDYMIEIKDLPLFKLLALVKVIPVILKDDVGEVRIGQIFLDGSALSSLVEFLPDVLDGVEIKKTTGSQGDVAIFSRTKAKTAEVNAAASGFSQERQVVPVNLSSYFGTAKEDDKDRKIKDLRDAIQMAFNMKAKGDGGKVGSVDFSFHGAIELGFLCGTPQDLAFAMMTLQTLGIKTPTVSSYFYPVNYTGSGAMAPPLVPLESVLGTEVRGQKIPMVPGIPNGGGMMNPLIPMRAGQALTGSNNLVNPQEILATLKKNQEQIAAMEATIRKLQQELETAKKGAGK